MQSLVLYDSVHGNTEHTARAIASVLEKRFSVRVVHAEKIAEKDLRGVELLVVGGPTHRHRMSRRLADVLKSMPKKSLKGIRVASFGTRYRLPAWLSGSAAGEIARRLRKLGGRLVLPPESFFVERDLPPEGAKRRHDRERMETGELERAAVWAAKVEEAAFKA
jgi:flavodoxin